MQGLRCRYRFRKKVATENEVAAAHEKTPPKKQSQLFRYTYNNYRRYILTIY